MVKKHTTGKSGREIPPADIRDDDMVEVSLLYRWAAEGSVLMEPYEFGRKGKSRSEMK